MSARSSGQVANGGTAWKVVLGQSNPHIALLTSTKGYSPLLDPPLKKSLAPAYTKYCPDKTQHVLTHDCFTRKFTPIQDVLSFLRARQILGEGEPSGQLSELQISVEALAVVTTWVDQGQQGRNFFAMAKEKRLHPDYLSAADRMVERVLADEGLYMPQCADPWHWQCGPDECPDKTVYYNEALACTFSPYISKWFAPRWPVQKKQEPDAGYLHLGDIDCAIVYLVLFCCALTMGVGTEKLPAPDRHLSNPLFFAHAVFQGCADKCPDIFGADTKLHKLFYLDKRDRDSKTHKAQLLPVMMEAYKKVWEKNSRH